MRLFRARGRRLRRGVRRGGTGCRRATRGDAVSYVVTRNINYTNVCYFRCQFCAFSKGKASENLRGRPYDLDLAEITRRVREAWERGATEVCMQGGIHPGYTGPHLSQALRAVKEAVPGMHVHAFSPLEISQGAATAGLPVRDFLAALRDAGLGDAAGGRRRRSSTTRCERSSARTRSAPENGSTWSARPTRRGLRSTATIMFGHVDGLSIVGAAPARGPGPPGANRRLHRDGAPPLRPHGGPHLPQGVRARRPTFREAVADACGEPPGAPPAHHQHPGVVDDRWGWRERSAVSKRGPTISAAR